MHRRTNKWKTLPKGWTQKSVEKFWESMTGEVKHKVTKCMKEMEGKVDDTGAFCGSLADKVDPGWRSRKKASRLASWWVMREAFNKENPVELMSQLMKILKREDAEIALQAIKQCKVTQKVNDALTKKTAADPRKYLEKLFKPILPGLKNPAKFMRHLLHWLQDERNIKMETADGEVSKWEETEAEIGAEASSYGPEYYNVPFQVPDRISLVLEFSFSKRDFETFLHSLSALWGSGVAPGIGNLCRSNTFWKDFGKFLVGWLKQRAKNKHILERALKEQEWLIDEIRESLKQEGLVTDNIDLEWDLSSVKFSGWGLLLDRDINVTGNIDIGIHADFDPGFR